MRDVWWVKPVLIGLLNYAVALPVIILFVGLSIPVIAVLVVGLAMGSWWIYDQRPHG